ncbi:MAG: YfjI family protein [Pseudomonadota bacterium]
MADLPSRARRIVADAAASQPWRDPMPWPTSTTAVPYPVDVLPAPMRAAIDEHRAVAQQPVELMACSTLAALSLAAQHIADVGRDERLVGPIGIYTLAIAESGERKSTGDKAMGATALRAGADELAVAMRPKLASQAATRAAWDERVAGLRSAIKRTAASGKKDSASTVERFRSELETLERSRPRSPCWPRLFLEDVTPEALKAEMGLGWPSGGLWSDEGGIVVGSRGMGDDAALAMFATLNRLWDGGQLQTDRRTMESYRATGRRFTACLMMQPAVFERLTRVAGGAARSSGTLARFLIVCPVSTAGTRFYVAPSRTDAGGRWAARLRELLMVPLPTTAADLALTPPVLHFTAEAAEIWRAFHDAVERDLREGERLAELRDVGSKGADNAARIAALFHLLEHGPGGVDQPIDGQAMTAATQIAGWHLLEAKRVLNETEMDDAVRDAKAVVRCCLDAGTRTRERVAQYVGRRRLRGREGRQRRDDAIGLALDLGWIRDRDGVLEPHPDAAAGLDR